MRTSPRSGGGGQPAGAEEAEVLQGMDQERLVTPEALRRQLEHLRDERAVVVLLVDCLDASATFLPRVRDIVGRNPVVLVGTKADLLPRGTDPCDVEEWLQSMAEFKRLTVAGVFLCSSRTGCVARPALRPPPLPTRRGRATPPSRRTPPREASPHLAAGRGCLGR